ncbi:MAG: hypothetical protein OER90_19455 [Gemmatimonadota bacterium]|nr:hypothetical protein [Gemmatimonadota bacterium]
MPLGQRLTGVLLAAGMVAILTAPSLQAQGVSIAPTVGVYAPTNDLVNSLISGGSTIAFRQKVGLALGGRIGISFGPRLGLTATGSYVPSTLQATITETGISQNAAQNTNLWFGTGRLNVWLLPPSSILALGLNGGVGVVGRGATTVLDDNGTAYTDQSRNDIGGVVGGTVGVNLGVLGVFVSVDDYIYNPSVFEQLGVKSETQNDLQFSFGLGGSF